MSASPKRRSVYAAASTANEGDEDAKREAMVSARRGFNEFSFDLTQDGRASLDELEEQLFLLGGNCTDELLKARDEAALAYSRMSGMLNDYDDLLASWTKRSLAQKRKK